MHLINLCDDIIIIALSKGNNDATDKITAKLDNTWHTTDISNLSPADKDANNSNTEHKKAKQDITLGLPHVYPSISSHLQFDKQKGVNIIFVFNW